jgi:hypothetical protein
MVPIARPQTRQFTAFTTNLAYARDLINAGQSLAGLQPGALDVGDLYRAAWVQAVSALDHWLHEELYTRVAALAANTGPGMPQHLQKFELPLSVIEEVRLGEVPIADAVVDHVKARWSFVSLQNPRKITEALKLVTDEDVWGAAAALINAWHHHATNLNANALKVRLSQVMERRNQIAHHADLEDGHLKQRHPIDAPAVTDAVDWIERIALAIATVLA